MPKIIEKAKRKPQATRKEKRESLTSLVEAHPEAATVVNNK